MFLKLKITVITFVQKIRLDLIEHGFDHIFESSKVERAYL